MNVSTLKKISFINLKLQVVITKQQIMLNYAEGILYRV